MPNDNANADVDISVTDKLDAADAAVISDGLRAYYVSQAGYYDFRPLAVFVRDPQTGKVIGGLHGRSEFGLVYVAWFFLPEAGIGRTAATSRRLELPIIIVIESDDPPNIVLTVLLREEGARILEAGPRA